MNDVCKVSVDSALALIVEKLDNRLGFKVSRSDAVLSIAIEGRTITVDYNSIPCFMDTIPEMITSYLVAQLLEVATAETLKGEALDRANANIMAKLVVLHQMEKVVNPAPISGENQSVST